MPFMARLDPFFVMLCRVAVLVQLLVTVLCVLTLFVLKFLRCSFPFLLLFSTVFFVIIENNAVATKDASPRRTHKGNKHEPNIPVVPPPRRKSCHQCLQEKTL
jgi:hypothetical protein